MGFWEVSLAKSVEFTFANRIICILYRLCIISPLWFCLNWPPNCLLFCVALGGLALSDYRTRKRPYRIQRDFLSIISKHKKKWLNRVVIVIHGSLLVLTSRFAVNLAVVGLLFL